MKTFLRLRTNNINSHLVKTARYQLYEQPQDTFPKPYNILDNLNPTRKYHGLKDESDK